MRKIKPVWYVTMKVALESCIYRKSFKPLTWLFKDHFYETSTSNVKYLGTLSEYIKYCRKNNLAGILDNVI